MLQRQALYPLAYHDYYEACLLAFKINKRFDKAFIEASINYLIDATKNAKRWSVIALPDTSAGKALDELESILQRDDVLVQEPALRTWIANRLTPDGWNRLLSSVRQKKLFDSGHIALIKTRSATHQRLTVYCKDHKLTQDEAINRLLDLALRT